MTDASTGKPRLFNAYYAVMVDVIGTHFIMTGVVGWYKNCPCLISNSTIDPSLKEKNMALILVVDDERDACIMLRRILTAMGHEVVAFTQVSEALSWLDHFTPELALVDFRLQNANGIQMLREIRERTPRAKVIMLTAYPSAELAEKVIRMGAVKYLSKPIEIDELETLITEVLRSGL